MGSEEENCRGKGETYSIDATAVGLDSSQNPTIWTAKKPHYDTKKKLLSMTKRGLYMKDWIPGSLGLWGLIQELEDQLPEEFCRGAEMNVLEFGDKNRFLG